MNSRRRRWLGAIGAVLVTGFLITSIAGADDERHKNPFTQILHKLDKILDKLDNGGSGDGNHTLRWDTNHPSSSRFVKLAAFNNQAVLDKNTGLVWDQAPDGILLPWGGAASRCVNRKVGGTVGWRLPSVVELKSVQDPMLPAPFVPTNVFTGVQAVQYWSATTFAENSPYVWFVDFINGNVLSFGSKSSEAHYFWCVRGPMQESLY